MIRMKIEITGTMVDIEAHADQATEEERKIGNKLMAYVVGQRDRKMPCFILDTPADLTSKVHTANETETLPTRSIRPKGSD